MCNDGDEAAWSRQCCRSSKSLSSLGNSVVFGWEIRNSYSEVQLSGAACLNIMVLAIEHYNTVLFFHVMLKRKLKGNTLVFKNTITDP